jgi:hypothetical protein
MAKSYKKNIHSNILNKGIWQYNPTTGLDETVSKNIANRNNKVSSSKSKEMTEKRIKINSNPVPKTTIKTSSPTSDAVREWSADNRARERHYGLKKGSTKSIIKVNSNPVPSKTRIGNLAGGGLRGGIGGGGMNWQTK